MASLTHRSSDTPGIAKGIAKRSQNVASNRCSPRSSISTRGQNVFISWSPNPNRPVSDAPATAPEGRSPAAVSLGIGQHS